MADIPERMLCPRTMQSPPEGLTRPKGRKEGRKAGGKEVGKEGGKGT